MEDTSVTPVLVLRALGEMVVLLGLVGLLFAATDLRRRLHPLGVGALSVFFTFLLAWGAVQLVDRWQYEYPQPLSFAPLTRFAMYQAQLEESVTETYAWNATSADGTTFDVNIAGQFSSVGLPPMSTRMRILLGDVQEPPGSADHEAAGRELGLYAQGLQAALGEDEVEVETVRFLRVTGTVADPAQEVLMEWTADELEATR